MIPSASIGGIAIYSIDNALAFVSGLAVDADGCPRAYAPKDSHLSPLDWLANSGAPGDWFGLVTDKDGRPIVQPSGYYLSPTSLQDHTRHASDPLRYVDAEHVPYIAVSPELRAMGVKFGDLAWVMFGGKGSAAIVADGAPHGHCGEGSIALASALGIPCSPKDGGVGHGVRTVVFMQSGKLPSWPRGVDEFSACASILFENWGGANRLGSV